MYLRFSQKFLFRHLTLSVSINNLQNKRNFEFDQKLHTLFSLHLSILQLCVPYCVKDTKCNFSFDFTLKMNPGYSFLYCMCRDILSWASLSRSFRFARWSDYVCRIKLRSSQKYFASITTNSNKYIGLA